jgi:hypothetical protein
MVISKNSYNQQQVEISLKQTIDKTDSFEYDTRTHGLLKLRSYMTAPLKIPANANASVLSYLRLRIAHVAINNLNVNDADEILSLFAKSTAIGGSFVLPSLQHNPARHIINAVWQIAMDTSNFYQIWLAEREAAQLWLRAPFGFGYNESNLQDKTIPELKSLALTSLSIAMQGAELHGFIHLNSGFTAFINDCAAIHLKDDSPSAEFVRDFTQGVDDFAQTLMAIQTIIETDPMLAAVYLAGN